MLKNGQIYFNIHYTWKDEEHCKVVLKNFEFKSYVV